MTKKDAKQIAEILLSAVNNSECQNCGHINGMMNDLSEKFPTINEAFNAVMGRKFQEMKSLMFYYELFNYHQMDDNNL